MSWTYLFDTAPLGTLFCAVGTVIFAARRAQKTDVWAKRNEDVAQAILTVESGYVWAFPLVGSIALVGLFYVFEYIGAVLMMLMSLYCAGTMYFVIYPGVKSITGNRRTMECPCVGQCRVVDAVALTISLLVSTTWLLTGHWILNNILGLSLCVACISWLRLPGLRVAAMLLGALLVFDVVWVFFSQPYFGKNVMVEVATKQASNPAASVARTLAPGWARFFADKLELPNKIIMPSYRFDYSSMLGLGDIVVPGMLIALAYRFDFALSGSSGAYFAWVVVGYTVGLMVAFTMSSVYAAAQPALLYLVPGTIIPLVALSMTRGELTKLWSGIGGSPKAKEVGA